MRSNNHRLFWQALSAIYCGGLYAKKVGQVKIYIEFYKDFFLADFTIN
jgi:hypothetical protein